MTSRERPAVTPPATPGNAEIPTCANGCGPMRLVDGYEHLYECFVCTSNVSTRQSAEMSGDPRVD